MCTSALTKKYICILTRHSLISPPKMGDSLGASASGEEGVIKEQDRLLPIANVG